MKRNIAIDLGNNNTILSDRENLLCSEPSIIALNNKTRGVGVVGYEAFEMEGKVNGHLKVVRPLRAGVIADLDAGIQMLKALVGKHHPSKSFLSGFNNVIAGVPYATTEVERRALRVALGQFNARRVQLIFEPLAAAIGMGLNIRTPDGKFLIDIGGGITEIALISLSGIVAYQHLKIGGDQLNSDIKNYMERQQVVAISDRMAEKIKLTIGAANENTHVDPQQFEAVGKDLITGIPKCIAIDYRELSAVLNHTITMIENSIMRVLEECPPELAGDIYNSGIYLTGGGALLKGLKERLENTTKLKVHLAKDPLRSVFHGIQKVLINPEEYRAMLFK